MKDYLYVNVMRGPNKESVHRISLVLTSADGGLIGQWGDVKSPRLLRSAAKPLQVLPLFTHGTVERWRISDAELAVMAGSHSGESKHIEVLAGLAQRTGLAVEQLQCQAAPPLSGQARAALLRAGESPTAFHHTCSGKHLAMLLLCLDQQWPLKSYLDAKHPVQLAIDQVIAAVCGVGVGQLTRALDGCGAPVHGVPLLEMARGYARLANGELTGKMRNGAERIRQAMFAHSQLVGGRGRLVTRLLEGGEGKWVAKDGAEALFCMGGPRGGVALKVEDGNERAVGPALLTVLDNIGWPLAGRMWDELRQPGLLTSAGERVGEIQVQG